LPTKLIIDQETHRIIGGVIVGPQAGDMIGEPVRRSRWAPMQLISAKPFIRIRRSEKQ
jgi:hypothetical protein